MPMEPITNVSIRRSVDPATEPVTLAELKAHVHEDLDDATNNTYMTALIAAARDWCEKYTNRSFITQTWVMTMQSFPASDRIYLPRGPIQSDGVLTVNYFDSATVLQTWSSSNYMTEVLTNSLYLQRDKEWPVVDTGYPWPIYITYRTGYGTAANVPETIKLAIKQLAAFWYEFRHGKGDESIKEQPTEAIKRLLGGYRLPEFH